MLSSSHLVAYRWLFCALAWPAVAQVFSVQPKAGSDWIGDGGPSLESILLQAEG